LEVETETNTEAENVWIRRNSACFNGFVCSNSLKHTKEDENEKRIAEFQLQLGGSKGEYHGGIREHYEETSRRTSERTV
jgi:hypothetical protein